MLKFGLFGRVGIHFERRKAHAIQRSKFEAAILPQEPQVAILVKYTAKRLAMVARRIQRDRSSVRDI